jgi:electron transfer flavoprotein alpha subunit
MSGILVVVEERAGRIARISWEAVAAGQRLGAQLGLPVSAAVVGAQTEALAAEFAASPLTNGLRLVQVVHPLLSPYTADGFTLALRQLIEQERPAQVVFPHTYQVRDYAPALAARFGQVLIGDVMAIGDGPVFTRQLLQGRLNGSYRHAGGGPCFISVQAGAFRAEASGEDPLPMKGAGFSLYMNQVESTGNPLPMKGTGFSPYMNQIESTRALAPEGCSSETSPENGPSPAPAAQTTIFTPVIDPAQIRTRPGEPWRGGAQTVDLGSAQRIVSVGRGIKEAENIPMVQELATALGAELAASRPICDNGWLPLERQVGSSGQTVSPKLYLAVGISGAIQHLVGMKGSQCVAAINKDPDAPIFEVADYGIVGDLFEVVPALTAAVNAARQ